MQMSNLYAKELFQFFFLILANVLGLSTSSQHFPPQKSNHAYSSAPYTLGLKK